MPTAAKHGTLSALPLRITMDASLLAKAQAGDRAALDLLLTEAEPLVYRVAMRLCGQRDDAADVTQQTLLAMARGVATFRGDAALSTWLFAVARSFCIKERRQSKYAPTHLAPLDEARDVAAPLEATSPHEALANKQAAARLDAVLAQMDPMYRDVLVLRDMEGLTAPEVAEVLALSVAAVKSRLHRARSDLRTRLVGEPDDHAGCPDVVTMLSQKLEGEIDANVCATLEAHVAACPRCSALCDSLKTTLSTCRSVAPHVSVPRDVQVSIRRAVRDFLAEATP